MHRLLFGDDVPEQPPASVERVLDGDHYGRIEGYHRSLHELCVFVRRSDEQVREYVFPHPRGLTDFFGECDDEYPVSQVRVKASAAGAQRFQFVNEGRQIILEVVACSCKIR